MSAQLEPNPKNSQFIGTDFDYDGHIVACAEGDVAALERLYEQECPRLLGVAMRILRDKELAEDAVQDAFVQVWTRAETFDPTRGSGRGWLYTIVRHRALREARSSNVVRRLKIDADDFDSLIDAINHDRGVADPTDSWINQQSLDHCLDALSNASRQCIEAAYIEGYSQSELAQLLDKPLGTVKSVIRRGLLALRECMG